MQKRHENALNDLLERVAYEGFAAVDKWQVTRWFGQERFSIGIRRDMRTRWEDLSAEISGIKKKELMFAEVKGQILLMHDQIFFKGDE